MDAYFLPPYEKYLSPEYAILPGFNWMDPRTHTMPFRDGSNMRLTIAGSNETYSLSYIAEHGSCQPIGVR